MLTRDGVAGLIGLALAGALLWGSEGLPRSSLVPIGPDFYPRILALLTGALSLLLLAGDIAGARARRAAPPAPARSRNYTLVLLAFVVFGAYIGAMPWIGFRLSTFAFVLGMQPLLEAPRGRAGGWLRVVIVATLTTLVGYVVFELYLHVLLPRGRLTGW